MSFKRLTETADNFVQTPFFVESTKRQMDFSCKQRLRANTNIPVICGLLQY